MLKYCIAVVLFCFSFINTSWALPWEQYSNHSSQVSDIASEKILLREQNFSGNWTGQCGTEPAIDMSIKHEKGRISISYGFMDEHYIIGDIKSETNSHLNEVESNNTTVRWNDEHNSLIFIHYYSFTSSENNLNIFFSKVSMSLNEKELLVKGHYYHTDGTINDFDQETISCIYHR